jgi:hypothetical protein
VKFPDKNQFVFGGMNRNDSFAFKSAGQELLSSDFLGIVLFYTC